MDFLTAAAMVLEQVGTPLHYKEIAQRALLLPQFTPLGQTPEATMGSRLYVDTKKDDSRFERIGRGLFALKPKSRQDEIARRVDEINDQARRALHKRLRVMPADRFEAFIGELLIAIGFDETSVQVTSYSNDGGIDVRGVMNAGDVTTVTASVQVKRWKTNVPVKVVRELRGSLTTHEQGIIITTSDYTADAQKEARAIGKAPISLVNGEKLIELLVKHSIGVNKKPYTVISLDEEWWNESNDALVPDSDEPSLIVEKVDVTRTAADVSFPLTVRALNKPDVFAELLSREGEMLFQDERFKKPSAPGMIASGWKSANGWTYWLYQDPESGEWRPIAELRRPANTPKHVSEASPPRR